MTKTEERVPDSSELNLDNPHSETFEMLVHERQAAKQVIEEMEAVVEGVDKKLGEIMDLNSIRAVTSDHEWLVSRRQGAKARKSIDRLLLLQNGVAPQTIEASTVEGKPGRAGVSVRSVRRGNDGYEDGE